MCYNQARSHKGVNPPIVNIDPSFYAVLALVGFVARLVGALLGLGGGSFLVPVLTDPALMNLPFQEASGISLVAVIATSTAGASTYVRTRLANIRLAVLLPLPPSRRRWPLRG